MRRGNKDIVRYRYRKGSMQYIGPDGKRRKFDTFRIVAMPSNSGKQIGMASIIRGFKGKNLFDHIEVNDKYQGRGISRELLSRLLAKVDGEKIYTRAAPFNNKSLSRNQLMKFYRKFGFKPTNKPGVSLGDDKWAVGTGPGAMVKSASHMIYSQQSELKKFASEYVTGRGPKFKVLKSNKVNLTPEERKIVMNRKAVWNHGIGGAATPAVWKSIVNGVTYYVTNTHRAYNVTKTLKGTINRYHKFIKGTA